MDHGAGPKAPGTAYAGTGADADFAATGTLTGFALKTTSALEPGAVPGSLVSTVVRKPLASATYDTRRKMPLASR
ncbi:hypothetical protein MTO96_030765 [Rhipicephalus appendiculatus]